MKTKEQLHSLKMIILFLFFPILLFSQEGNDDWIAYKSVEGVDISYRYQECNNPSQGTYKEYVVFQFINNTSEVIEISYSYSLWYDEKEIADDYNENSRYIIIEADETFETSCFENREYNIFSKFLNYEKSELTNFELVDIVVIIK